MHKVAVFSAKGGSGKSALTVFLAELLASRLHKKRVLVIDLDPQQSSSTALLGEERLLRAVGEGRSVDRLIVEGLRAGGIDEVLLRRHLIVRPEAGGKGANILGGVAVIAPDREGWHNLNDDLAASSRPGSTSGNGQAAPKAPPLHGGLTPPKRIPEPPSRYASSAPIGAHASAVELPRHLRVLEHGLEHLGGAFDVCLLDFPAQGRAPLVQIGLWAAAWWLYPVQPNRAGVRDLDGSRSALRAAFRGQRSLRGLGTVLYMGQSRAEFEYKRARPALERMAGLKRIPPLFSPDAEVGVCSDARKALDETLEAKTIRQKFGETDSAFSRSLRKLVREALDRLGEGDASAATGQVDHQGDVNADVTRTWSAPAARAGK